MHQLSELQYLMTCAMEECAEVQQAFSKALRFGLEDINPREQVTAREVIQFELNDLYTVLDRLQQLGVGTHRRLDWITAKQKRIDQYMEYARKVGTLITKEVL